MKIFLDTADIKAIKRANDTGLLSGVTTNPYTETDDFTWTDLIVDELGDGQGIRVSISDEKNNWIYINS